MAGRSTVGHRSKREKNSFHNHWNPWICFLLVENRKLFSINELRDVRIKHWEKYQCPQEEMKMELHMLRFRAAGCMHDPSATLPRLTSPTVWHMEWVSNPFTLLMTLSFVTWCSWDDQGVARRFIFDWLLTFRYSSILAQLQKLELIFFVLHQEHVGNDKYKNGVGLLINGLSVPEC